MSRKQDVNRRQRVSGVQDVAGRRKYPPLDGTWNRRRTRASTGLRTLQADGGTCAAHRTGDTEWSGCELWEKTLEYRLLRVA